MNGDHLQTWTFQHNFIQGDYNFRKLLQNLKNIFLFFLINYLLFPSRYRLHFAVNSFPIHWLFMKPYLLDVNFMFHLLPLKEENKTSNKPNVINACGNKILIKCLNFISPPLNPIHPIIISLDDGVLRWSSLLLCYSWQVSYPEYPSYIHRGRAISQHYISYLQLADIENGDYPHQPLLLLHSDTWKMLIKLLPNYWLE